MIKTTHKLEVSLIMLICVFLLSACEEKKESGLVELEYPLGTSLQVILENEEDLSPSDEEDDGIIAYGHKINSEDFFCFQCKEAIEIYYFNKNDELIGIVSVCMTNNETESEEIYNSLLQIIKDSECIYINDVLYKTKEGDMEIVIANTGKGVKIRQKAANLNEDGTFK